MPITLDHIIGTFFDIRQIITSNIAKDEFLKSFVQKSLIFQFPNQSKARMLVKATHQNAGITEVKEYSEPMSKRQNRTKHH